MPRLQSETFGGGDQSWLGSDHGIWNCRTIAPDPALFTTAVYPDSIVPSGTPIGLVTATGLYGPYTGDSTDEVWTFTEGGSGLTSWTITILGETTASIDDDATAAQVQAAIDAAIGADKVLVTGGPLATGPFTVTAIGDLANQNLAQPTTTPTGGTGTVVVATTVAGGADAGSDGREVLAGFLFTDQKITAEGGWPLLDHGRIKVDRLPIPFAATGHNTTGQFVFIAGDHA
jgi:hypothetical protein